MTPRALMTEYLAAARRGDWATAYGYMADDLRIRIPGRSAWAGERIGKRFLGAAPVEILRADAYTVRGSEIVAIEIFEGDQYAVDELVH